MYIVVGLKAKVLASFNWRKTKTQELFMSYLNKENRYLEYSGVNSNLLEFQAYFRAFLFEVVIWISVKNSKNLYILRGERN